MIHVPGKPERDQKERQQHHDGEEKHFHVTVLSGSGLEQIDDHTGNLSHSRSRELFSTIAWRVDPRQRTDASLAQCHHAASRRRRARHHP